MPFFVFVLTHEMAHALLSQPRGIPVRDITLFLFGGATRANANPGLGVINLLLGVFNLIPGLPLDGGGFSGQRCGRGREAWRGSPGQRADRGRGIGYAMTVIGLLVLFRGALTNGLWFAAIGWFLAGAARSSYVQVESTISWRACTPKT